ncbi:MAG: SCP-like extracellular [Candidatus Electrothrix sp. ATG1]|nr:SCP-like extracellular [Candidatus Electrothrix sp. ATG1]
MKNTIKVLVGASVLSLFLTVTQQEPLAQQNAVDPQAMTAAHNALRSQLGVPGLKWSGQLANAAQDWANQLAQTSCRLRQSSSGYGENLYWAGPKTYSNGIKKIQEISGQDVVNTWIYEGKTYSYPSNSCKGECGNYTQVIWRDTTEVGCGMALCSDKAQIWVCNYSPAGNVIGRKPY